MFSVTILTKNSAKYLPKVLDSLTLFPEVILLDTGSVDETCSIGESYKNVKIFHRPFVGFGETHNIASSLATYDWIFSIDSDEVVTQELAKEIISLALDESAVYTIPRNNYYRGKLIKGCGWYPDRVKRLYNRKRTSFSKALVHETVEVQIDMRRIELRYGVDHYPYDTVRDFLKKLDSYSSLYASQMEGKSYPTFCTTLLHTFWAFFRNYLLRRGWLLGREGFEISVYNAVSTFYKYLKLIEKNECKFFD
ncbi:MAG: glycosyltransferase family 2 protein [Chlamydia sp.]